MLSLKVLKRDGRFVDFDVEKISNAIFKAAKAVGGEDRSIAGKLANEVCKKIANDFSIYPSISVEEIQDIVEKILIENGHAKTAKAYILYRKQRSDIRDFKNSISDAENILDEYLTNSDWRVKENSNTTFSLQGLNNFIASSITAKYWLNKIYPEEVKRAHSEGDFHIHDLGSLSVYCCGWDLKELLLRGFGGVKGKVESAPAKHFRTALGQIVNFFYTLQGEAAGAQAFANFDTLLAPYVAYDNLTYKEVVQCMQEFIFNLNVPTRVGFQTPFTNLTFDIVVPNHFKNEAVVHGGKITEDTYSKFQKEMDMINLAFVEIMSKGDAKGRIFTFPIPTYNISKEFDWDDPLIEPLMKMTGKYGMPYFANFVNSNMSPDDARSMCCRLRLDNRELRKRGGGLFGANPLTGSIGVVTINLAKIGYLSKSKEEYFDRLSYLMELSRLSLKLKRKVLENLTEKGLYPYSQVYLDGILKHTGKYWSNHFNTIGIIGMNESLLNFLGVDITNEEGLTFATEVLNFMNKKLVEFQKEDGDLYNLEATPAEGTSYRLAKKDKEHFGKIITSGTDKTPYYTNSTQLPVGCSLGLFSALEHQNKLQPLYTGGTVFHTFIGESIDDTTAVKELVKYISDNYSIPYFTITPTFSICPVHGYLKGEHHYCPLCKEEEKANILGEIELLKKEV